MNTHRDKYLDTLEGKRVKVWFKDGDLITGNLTFNEGMGKYRLKNCFDNRKGFVRSDVVFRKSHIKRLEVAHG